MKTKKPKTTKLMWFFFATLAIILLFVIFSTGFHNADLGYNFKGNGAYDCNLMNCVPLERVYMGGMMMMQSSFIISIVLNLVLVYFLLEK